MSAPLFVGPEPTLFDPDPPRLAIPERLAVAFRRVVHASSTEPFDVYVGRNFAGRHDSGFGNQVSFVDGAGRYQAIVDYHRWLTSPAGAAVRARAVADLGGRVLGCWCAPEPCHGWILAAVAAGLDDELAVWIAELEVFAGSFRH